MNWSKFTRVNLILATILAGLASLSPAGCGFDFPEETPEPTPTSQPEPEDVIFLRLENETSFALETELYLGTNGLAATPENIFVPENIYTNGVGLASSGLLPPRDDDDVIIPCGEGLVVATAGGTFLDPETGEVEGTGPNRILQQDLVFDCGVVMTFTYRQTANGFTVLVTLE